MLFSFRVEEPGSVREFDSWFHAGAMHSKKECLDCNKLLLKHSSQFWVAGVVFGVSLADFASFAQTPG
jgi:hypothetical protein